MMSNDGKYLEKIVHILEKSLSPDDTVEHDVFLPILNSNEGHKAQCDIVIKRGKIPRQTTTIVEVQDRNTKVDINTFRGWLGKLEDVGAQHLIAVSKKEFPSSVKEKVKQSGNKVFLMNIKNSMPEEIPNFVDFKFIDKKFAIVRMSYFSPTFSRSKAELLGISRDDIYKKNVMSIQEKIWSFDKKEILSFNEIAFLIEKTRQNILSIKGKSKLEFDSETNCIYQLINDKFLPITLECEYEWEYKIKNISPSIFSYEQVNDETLAWLIEFDYEDENGKTNLKVPVIKSGEHYLVMPNSMIFESDNTSELSLNLVRER